MPPRLPFPAIPRSLNLGQPSLIPITFRPLPSSALPRRSLVLKSPHFHHSARPYVRYKRFGAPSPSAGGGRRPTNRFQQAQQLWRTSPTFRYTIIGLGGSGTIFYIKNLERVPGSGRLRFNCVPEWVERKVGDTGFKQAVQQYRGRILPPQDPRSRMVNRVLKRIVETNVLGEEEWEVRVIDDDEMNAFVMAG